MTNYQTGYATAYPFIKINHSYSTVVAYIKVQGAYKPAVIKSKGK